jgi:hypothetical protein
MKEELAKALCREGGRGCSICRSAGDCRHGKSPVFAKKARRLLGDLESQGLTIVPLESTQEMRQVGREACRNNGLLPAYTDKGGAGQEPIMSHMLGEAYRAMLKAAQGEES